MIPHTPEIDRLRWERIAFAMGRDTDRAKFPYALTWPIGEAADRAFEQGMIAGAGLDSRDRALDRIAEVDRHRDGDCGSELMDEWDDLKGGLTPFAPTEKSARPEADVFTGRQTPPD